MAVDFMGLVYHCLGSGAGKKYQLFPDILKLHLFSFDSACKSSPYPEIYAHDCGLQEGSS